MQFSIPRSKTIQLLAFMIIVTLIITGCSGLQSAGQTGGSQSVDAFDEIDLSREGDDSDGSFDDSDEGVGSDSIDGSEEENSEDGLKNFSCPEAPKTFELWSNYYIKFKTEAVGTWDIEGSGGQLVSIADGITNKAAYGLNPEELRIPGFVKGEFSRDGKVCKFSQDLEIISVVSGNCQKGVINLKITTNFSEVNTELSCCKGGDCHTGPFYWSLPVVQLEIKLSEANGFTVTKPFTGGEGELRWELQNILIPPPID